jgi:hypothetical protein
MERYFSWNRCDGIHLEVDVDDDDDDAYNDETALELIRLFVKI